MPPKNKKVILTKNIYKQNDIIEIIKKGSQRGQLAIIVDTSFLDKTGRYKVLMRTGDSVGEIKSYEPKEIKKIKKISKKFKVGTKMYANVAMNIMANDYCLGTYSKDCKGNLNILRENMPQILDVPLNKKNIPEVLQKEQQSAVNKIILKMKDNGYDKDTFELLNSSTKSPFDYVVKHFKAKKKKVKVNDLIPTQKEIRKSSTRFIIKMEMLKQYKNHKSFKSSSILNGLFLTINENGKIYVLDGHHRWSAMKRIYPNEYITTYQIKSNNVKTTINKLLKLNYVYTEGLTGQTFL
jgi:hypothetical protein